MVRWMVGSPNARMVITATIASEIARICVISCFSLNTEDASIRPSKQARYTGKPPSIGVCFRRLSAKRQCDSGRIEGWLRHCTGSARGPQQVALIAATMIAVLIGWRRGRTLAFLARRRSRASVPGWARSLLAAGALIGTSVLSGRLLAMVNYG